jgi:RND family efflux transporter MFP subunit
MVMMSTEPPVSPAPKPGPEAVSSEAICSRSIRQRSQEFLRRQAWPLAALLLLAAAAIPAWRALSRVNESTSSNPATTLQPVAVAKVTREDLYTEVPIPAEFRPYQEVELHAKVSGYVQEMKVDFGDRVKAGQLLATLDVPELKDELDRALSAKQKAEADYTDAHAMYSRLFGVQQQNAQLVPQQEVDNAAAKDRMTEAAIAEAKADVEKYRTMLAYTRITAPFDGVITRRYVDPGALIQAGTTSETQSLPVVRVSDNYHLRLDFPVSVDYVKDVRIGDAVEVRVESLGGKTLAGTITRAELRVNSETRTMITEIEVPNPKLELVPGMYAEVMLKAQRRAQALAVPIEALPPGQSATAYVVNGQNEIEERPVTLGLETASRCEVVSGLREGERVLVGTRSVVKPGQKVEPKLLGALAQQ